MSHWAQSAQVRASVLSLAGAGLSRLSGLALSFLFARALGLTQVGEIGVLQSTIGLFSIFAGFGVGLTASKYVAEYRESDPSSAASYLAVTLRFAVFAGLGAALVLVLTAPWLASESLNAPHLTLPLRIAGLLLFFNTLNGAQLGALTGLHAFRPQVITNVTNSVLTLVLAGGLSVLWGVAGAITGMSLASAVTCALASRQLTKELSRQHIPRNQKPRRTHWSVLIRFTLPALLGNSISGPATWLVATFLAHQGNGYVELGFYSVGLQWRNAVLLIPWTLSSLITPFVAGQSKGEAFAVARRFVVANIVIAALVAGAVLFSMPLILRGYGPHFEDARTAFALLVAGGVVIAVNNGLSRFLDGRGAVGWSAAGNFVWAIVIVGASFRLASHGAAGMASAAILASLIQLAMQAGAVRVVGRRSI